ncbi:unnamed protein product [Sphagnum balticum]
MSTNEHVVVTDGLSEDEIIEFIRQEVIARGGDPDTLYPISVEVLGEPEFDGKIPLTISFHGKVAAPAENVVPVFVDRDPMFDNFMKQWIDLVRYPDGNPPRNNLVQDMLNLRKSLDDSSSSRLEVGSG